MDIEFDGDKQKVKGKSGDVDRSLIFVIVYIGEQLGDEDIGHISYLATELLIKKHLNHVLILLLAQLLNQLRFPDSNTATKADVVVKRRNVDTTESYTQVV